MNTSNETPNFINPVDLRKMSDAEIDIMLDGIRIRRKQKLVIYQEMLAKKNEAQIEKMRAQYDRTMDMAHKALERLDKALENYEMRINQIRALKLQIEGAI